LKTCTEGSIGWNKKADREESISAIFGNFGNIGNFGNSTNGNHHKISWGFTRDL
jgi:hypothetical protein